MSRRAVGLILSGLGVFALLGGTVAFFLTSQKNRPYSMDRTFELGRGDFITGKINSPGEREGLFRIHAVRGGVRLYFGECNASDEVNLSFLMARTNESTVIQHGETKEVPISGGGKYWAVALVAPYEVATVEIKQR